MPNLDALFSPRSIALVGASPDPHVIRGRMVSAVLDNAYPGTVYAISRSHRAIRGLTCYRSVADLPEAVDLAIVTVPACYVGDVLEACAARGTRAAVIISSGFAEERGAEGRARQERITALAERHDMAVLGPNGEGFLNAALPLHASFSPVLVEGDPPSPPGERARGIGVISQSGGIGFSFYDRAHPRCLPFSYVVSTGNEAGLSTLDVLEHLISDAATGVVMLFVEGFKGAQRFAPIAARAALARKPIIVTKVGRSDAAARAAVSHTASITGSHSAYEAMFRAHGVLNFPDADRMLDAAAALSYFHDRLPRGRRTAVLTASGGAGIWAADACVDAGLEVGPIDDATRVRLGENLPSYASTANPVDLTAQGLFDHGYAKPLEVLAASDAVDAVVVTCSMVRSDLITSDLDDLKRLGATCDKPIAFCAYTRANPEAVRALAAANFPCFASGHHAAAALAALVEYREFLDRAARDAAPAVPPTTESSAEVRNALARAGDVLCEWEARGVLAAGGVAEPFGTLVADANQAVAAAFEIGAPVALKVQSGAIVHKSDAGGVALGLEGDDAVARGYRRVLENAARYAPGAEIAGVLVQPMAGPGVEMLLGTRRDETFGPMLVMGFGGALVEVVRDRVETPVPVSPGRCRELVDRLAVRALLEGVRGAPAADVDALVELACRLSRFAHAHSDLVEEIDLNPVLVHPREEGVSIVDALVVKRKIP